MALIRPVLGVNSLVLLETAARLETLAATRAFVHAYLATLLHVIEQLQIRKQYTRQSN